MKYTLNTNEFEKYTWNVIESYFKEEKGKVLINHQLESFNDFIFNKIEEIINGFNSIEIFHKFNTEEDQFEYVIEIDVIHPIITKPTVHEKNCSTKIKPLHEQRHRNYNKDQINDFNID